MNATTDLTPTDLADATAAAAHVSNFYALMLREMDEAGYSTAQKDMMNDPVLYYGRYLDPKTRLYFEETVIPVIGAAMTWFREPDINCVLDLGCGLAMQSIILAALGKRVLAVDIRPASIDLSRKRKKFYEGLLGRQLAIDFVCGDFLELDLSDYKGSIDGIFSMSAFSYIQPLESTVERIATLSSPRARLFLFEENSKNLVARTLRRRPVPRPDAVIAEFAKRGFSESALRGTCALPKQLWRNPFTNGAVRRVDQLMRMSLLFAFSYALTMERQG